MKKKVYLTYSDATYESSKKFAVMMARVFGGFDEVVSASPSDVDEYFKNHNSEIFAYRRGAGLWLWKPYIVNKVLSRMDDGDILFYADAGCFVYRNVKHIVDLMNQDIWLCELPLVEKQYTKRVCFEYLGCNGDVYENTPQRLATYFCVRKSEMSVKVVKEWLEACQRIELISPLENDGELISHREDQSILSLLSKKYGILGFATKRMELSAEKGAVYLDCSGHPQSPNIVVVHKHPSVNFMLLLRKLLPLIAPQFIINKYIKKKMKTISPPPITIINITYCEAALVVRERRAA